MFPELTVVDLGVGMAPALIAKVLRDLGARVIRVPPQACDPFFSIYPAYRTWRHGQTIDAEASKQKGRLADLLATADICIIGGEDHPDLQRRTDAQDLSRQNPRLIVLEIEACPPFSSGPGSPGVDILMQARSGLAFEGYSNRPNVMAFEPSNYGAALYGLMAIFAALYEREHSHRGQIVSTSLFEGALAWMGPFLANAEKPSPDFDRNIPKDTVPLILGCADGVAIQVVLGTPGSKAKFYRALGIDHPTVDPTDNAAPNLVRGPKYVFGDIELYESYTSQIQSVDLLKALWNEGLAAETVLSPGACWDHPQVRHNRFITRHEDGTRAVGLPFSATLSAGPKPVLGSVRSLPLSGLRVVDFGAYLAGPGAAVPLADLGAEVIKVEALTPDPGRRRFRFYSSVNRGKRAISLDLKTQKGQEIFKRLCARADVAMNNFRPGAAARLGLDPKGLWKINPNLIVLETSGFGATGPIAERSCLDPIMQAFAGHEIRAGGVGNRAMWNRSAFSDIAAAGIGGVAVLMALYHRARSGGRGSLDVSLLGAGLFLLAELVQKSDGTFEGAPLLNHTQTGYHPAESFYAAQDGWIAIAARGDAAARRLAEALSLSQIATLPRNAWGDAEASALAAAISVRSCASLLASLAAADVWAEPCRPEIGGDILRDPELIAAGIVSQVQHPEYGSIAAPGPLFRFSRSRRTASRHAPLVGEHTREILAELGYAAAEIDHLFQRKVVA